MVGYGDIGQETANIARAFKMNIIALWRRTQLSKQEQDQGLKVKLFLSSIKHMSKRVVP